MVNSFLSIYIDVLLKQQSWTSNFTKTSGQMEILIDVKLVANIIMSSESSVVIKND